MVVVDYMYEGEADRGEWSDDVLAAVIDAENSSSAVIASVGEFVRWSGSCSMYAAYVEQPPATTTRFHIRFPMYATEARPCATNFLTVHRAADGLIRGCVRYET
jgi:hypothetical protein